MSYGASLADLYRRKAELVDKNLRGARPSDLPIERPTKFKFVLNLKTAKALLTIRAGTKKSSNIEVSATQTAVDRDLSTFTIIDWTSTSRNITSPYTLVFTLRADDNAISKSEAKDVWHQILRTTLHGEDLQKLGEEEVDWWEEEDDWEEEDGREGW
jgi:hypothetical protein